MFEELHCALIMFVCDLAMIHLFSLPLAWRREEQKNGTEQKKINSSHVSHIWNVKILANCCLTSSSNKAAFVCSSNSHFLLFFVVVVVFFLIFTLGRKNETNKKLININFSSSVIDWILRHDFLPCHELHQYIQRSLPPISSNFLFFFSPFTSMMNYFFCSFTQTLVERFFLCDFMRFMGRLRSH